MTTTPLPPQPAATYTLTIVADSGYESTMEGRCDAEQYALAVKALHEPAATRADLEAEVQRLREALTDIKYGLEGARIWGGMEWAYNPLHPFKYLPLIAKAEAALEGTK